MASKDKVKKGAPAWMATFADMSTLLMTFFVLMLSMANIDIAEFREMLGSVKQAFGVQIQNRGEFQAVLDKEIVPQNASQKSSNRNVNAGALAEYYGAEAVKAVAQAEALEKEKQDVAVAHMEEAIGQTNMGEMAEVMSGSRGIRVRVKGALLFDPGTADLKAQAKPFLDNVVHVLKKFGYFLVIEGHTDSVPISTQRYPSNWELSGARAAAVLRYLINANIEPRLLTCVGLADNYPLASNTTAEGRARNRRVEFVLTKAPFRAEID